MQIDVERKRPRSGATSRSSAADFRGGTAFRERAIRIDRIRVPAMNALVSPGAHARQHEQIDSLRIVGRASLEELQRAVHAARLVAVHAARHEHHREIVAPVATAHREQTIVIGWIVELAVLLDIEARSESLDAVTTSSA